MRKLIFSILLLFFCGCAGISPNKNSSNVTLQEFAKNHIDCIVKNDFECNIKSFEGLKLTNEQITSEKLYFEKISLLFNQYIKEHKGLKNVKAIIKSKTDNFYIVDVFCVYNDKTSDLKIKNLKLSFIDGKWKILNF